MSNITSLSKAKFKSSFCGFNPKAWGPSSKTCMGSVSIVNLRLVSRKPLEQWVDSNRLTPQRLMSLLNAPLSPVARCSVQVLSPGGDVSPATEPKVLHSRTFQNLKDGDP